MIVIKILFIVLLLYELYFSILHMLNMCSNFNLQLASMKLWPKRGPVYLNLYLNLIFKLFIYEHLLLQNKKNLIKKRKLMFIYYRKAKRQVYFFSMPVYTLLILFRAITDVLLLALVNGDLTTFQKLNAATTHSTPQFKRQTRRLFRFSEADTGVGTLLFAYSNARTHRLNIYKTQCLVLIVTDLTMEQSLKMRY